MSSLEDDDDCQVLLLDAEMLLTKIIILRFLVVFEKLLIEVFTFRVFKASGICIDN